MSDTKLTKKQLGLLWATAKSQGLNSYEVHEIIDRLWGHNSVHELTALQFEALVDFELSIAARAKAEPAVTITFAPLTEAELKARVDRL